MKLDEIDRYISAQRDFSEYISEYDLAKQIFDRPPEQRSAPFNEWLADQVDSFESLKKRIKRLGTKKNL